MPQPQVAPIAAIIFDVGGVLVTDAPDAATLARRIGCDDPVALGQAFWRHRNAYDAGASDTAYWAAIAADLGLPQLAPSMVAELVAEDAARWSRASSAALELVHELHGAGLKLAILSNAPHALAQQMRNLEWSAPFEALVFSCDTGVLKPEPGAYAAVLATLAAQGVAREQCIFLDDRPANVAGAQESGLAAIVWQGAATARTALRQCGVKI